MTQFLFANPGQIVTIAIQTLNQEGVRTDPSSPPSVVTLYDPSLSAVSGYPAQMTKLSTGLYRYQISFDKTATLGTYIASITWIHPDTAKTQYEVVNIHLVRTFGLPTVS
jgi:hypothetical protein